MRAAIALVTLVVAFAAGESLSRAPTEGTNIATYPFMAALLRGSGTNFQHSCAGTLLNNRSVLTAARCLYNDFPNQWRFRLGSSWHNSGGTVYFVSRMAFNAFDQWGMLNDISVIRTNDNIVFGTNVRAGSFAGANYILDNNQAVLAVGWGNIGMPLWQPAQFNELRRHEQRTIAGDSCRIYYSSQGFFIRDASQICSGFSGWVGPNDVRAKCLGEPGAPLLHGNTIVGVRSYALNCDFASVPTVSTRVGNYISWISSQS